MEQKMLDRATYKKIKGMIREEMQNFLTNYYNNVMKDAEAPTLDPMIMFLKILQKNLLWNILKAVASPRVF